MPRQRHYKIPTGKSSLWFKKGFIQAGDFWWERNFNPGGRIKRDLYGGRQNYLFFQKQPGQFAGSNRLLRLQNGKWNEPAAASFSGQYSDYDPYFRKRHAFWKMYGLNLPDEVLKKFYYKNALKIIPGIEPKMFPE